jgi:diguanylate cyclase (GGDEF)-like protein
MSHRSKVLLWSRNADRSASVQQALDQQGVSLRHLEKSVCEGVSFANVGANALVVDFNQLDPITEDDFRSLWSAAHKENLKVIYLTDSQETLPAFAPREDESVQILAGPALEQQLISRLRLLTRIETMAEEISQRSATLNAFGIDTPYDTSGFESKAAKVLLVSNLSKDFMVIEKTISSSGNKVVGAYTQQMAFEFLDNDSFDLIVFEASEDRQALFDFTAAVRQDARFFNIPLLVIGSNEQIGAPEKLYSAGVTEIAFKPIIEAALSNAAKALIREYHYHHHLSTIYYSAEQDSVLDGHTGLFRYGFLMDHLTSQLEQSVKFDTSLTVTFFDMLRLNAINETCGYAAGDSLIRQIGNIISRFFRGEDLCARYGGEEFVAVLPRTRLAEATSAVRRLVSTVNATQFQLQSGMPPVNFSLTYGLAEYEHGDTAQTIIDRARKAAHPN